MNKKLLFSIILVMLLLIPTIVMAHTEEEPFKTDLIADGGDPSSEIDVGDVLVWNDGVNLYVKYVIDAEGWCLTDTHLHVAESLEEIPQKNGNPPPGKFNYQMEHDCVTEYMYTIPLTWHCGDNLFMAAHAVVQLEDSCPAIMYGTSLGASGVGDKIYKIDVATLTATELFNTGLSPSSINGPNGNAYDSVNNWLYYSVYTSSDYLYFYDFTNPVNNPSGPLPGGMVACAGWYSGKYYYIPQLTGKLYDVTFNIDGTINTATNICDYSGKSFNFGDVAITPKGLMYGSSAVNEVGRFWSIDLIDFTYTEISTLAHMQLAFGSDGVLYGHDAGNANFYTIDPVLGTRTKIDTIDSLKFTDLASGLYEPCTYQTETAWGDGKDFSGKNWATYFTYKVQPELVDTVYVDSSDVNGADSIIVLESGKNYRFEAMGTWRDTSQPDHYIDAEYTTFNSWTNYLDGTLNWGPNQKDLQVNNLFVDWGSYSDVHTYYLDYPGIGSIVNFRVFDGNPATNIPESGWYGDNIGSLTVNIYRLP